MKPHHGYGWFMKDTERGLDTRLHYILLGAREHLRPVKPPSVSGIHVHQLKWAELNGCKSNPLLDDLFTSLGYLGVPGFLMEDAEKIKITTDFGPTGKAFDVLNALGSEAACGFRPSYWRVKAERPEPKLFNIGAYLHKPPPSKEISRLHRQLDAAVQPPGNLLLWTGYETGGDLIARRSVWFFCSNIVKPNNSALASNRTSRSNATGRFFAQSSQIPLTKMTWHGFRKYSEKPLNEKILTTI
jgi:hypothetical protein